MKTRIRTNLLANFAGKILTALISIIFVPIYIRILGMEAYGLIGFYISLQTFMIILDFGLSTTLGRELARNAAKPDAVQHVRNLVKTIVTITWGMSLFIAATVFFLSPLIAKHWLGAEKLSPDVIKNCVILMGLVIAIQWPSNVYNAGLQALERQVAQNIIMLAMSILKNVGVIAYLLLVTPTIEGFFEWQIIVGIAYTMLTGIILRSALPNTDSPSRFDLTIVKDIWKFSASILGINIISLILTQTDKIILSKLLDLKEFGYYALATVVSTSLFYLTGPVVSAVFPRINQMIATGDQNGVISLYHSGCQIVSLLVLPTCAILCTFSYEIMLLWTQDHNLASQTKVLVALLVIGNSVNCLLQLPFNMQIAVGWTRLTIVLNVIAILLLIPLMIFLITQLGSMGAAITWIIITTVNLFVGIHLMHKKVLIGEKRRWYVQDIIFPLLGVIAVILPARMIVSWMDSFTYKIVGIFIAGCLTFLSACLATSISRTYIFKQLGVGSGRIDEYQNT